MGKAVLMMGLKQAPKQMVPPDNQDTLTKYSPEEIKKIADADLAKIKGAGFYVENYFADTNNTDLLDDVKKVFTSRHWDGISIGFGVRGTPELTGLFEDLVNMAVAEMKPTPKFMFALRPDSLFRTVQRAFPEGA